MKNEENPFFGNVFCSTGMATSGTDTRILKLEGENSGILQIKGPLYSGEMKIC